MTINRYTPAKTAHCNPGLKQGQTYRITGAAPDCVHRYLGRYFVVTHHTGETYLVYLHDDKANGGYDHGIAIDRCGIEFVQVDLAEA